jgi:hypothetical protein
MESRWKTIDSLHWELDSEILGEQDDYEQLFEKYEKQYSSMKKALNVKMWSASHKEKSTPVIDLPVFNGAYQQWTSFKDLFIETIHSNPALSKAQKMQFLKSKVKRATKSYGIFTISGTEIYISGIFSAETRSTNY